MSKTAREVIADSVRAYASDPHGWVAINVPACADQIIQNLDAAGFVIAPKEPTKEMIAACGPEGIKADPDIVRGVYADVYRAMITAAPTASGK